VRVKLIVPNKKGHKNGGVLPMSKQHLCHCHWLPLLTKNRSNDI